MPSFLCDNIYDKRENRKSPEGNWKDMPMVINPSRRGDSRIAHVRSESSNPMIAGGNHTAIAQSESKDPFFFGQLGYRSSAVRGNGSLDFARDDTGGLRVYMWEGAERLATALRTGVRRENALLGRFFAQSRGLGINCPVSKYAYD
jgi:hypothetical protein